SMSNLLWFVAHTHARCEKKLVRYCDRYGLQTTLPCYRAVHKYRRKIVTFHKPLFPCYLFLQISPYHCSLVRQNDCVATLLTVPDQQEFTRQLADILLALQSNLEVMLA